MSTDTKAAFNPAFTMTQAEADAVEAVQQMPYRDGENADIKARTGIFMSLYGEHKMPPRPSREIDQAFAEAFVTGDYSGIDAMMPGMITMVEQMFVRAGFDCERTD